MNDYYLFTVIVILFSVISHAVGFKTLGTKFQTIEPKEEDKKESEEHWLVDSIYYDAYQGDDPVHEGRFDFCPPVPEVTSEEICIQNTCQSDADCDESYRCCYNGCAFACLVEVRPPAVVDWMKEPRRSRSGLSWLISGPGPSSIDVEPCSTTPVDRDEDPLLCPHGYFCHLEHTGDPDRGIPNRGYCVQESDKLFVGVEADLREKSGLETANTCFVENVILLDGANMRFRNKRCRCRKGFLSCTRRKHVNASNVEIQVKKNTADRRRRVKTRRKGRGNKS